MISQTKITADEVIHAESPLVSSQFSWNKAYGYLACDHCLFPLESAQDNIRRLTFDPSIILPYPEADPTKEVHEKIVQCDECGVKYCSLACQEEAKTNYHDLMCPHQTAGQSLDGINEIWK